MSRVYRKAECVFCHQEGFIHAKGLCQACYQRQLKNGSPERIKVRGTCKVEGCDNPHASLGFCGKHLMRFKRHGHLNPTRPEDWGAKHKHPLYNSWRYLREYRWDKLCEEWKKDFWQFYEDVGDRPSDKHKIKLVNPDGMYEKENVVWNKIETEADINYNAYQREYRAKNPDIFRNISLKKSFGITLDQYNKMLEEQKGLCAICGKAETQIHPSSHQQKPQYLAVDHCHTTNQIRGLLCSQCNKGIGAFQDDPNLLQKAIDYLKKFDGGANIEDT